MTWHVIPNVCSTYYGTFALVKTDTDSTQEKSWPKSEEFKTVMVNEVHVNQISEYRIQGGEGGGREKERDEEREGEERGRGRKGGKERRRNGGSRTCNT